MPVTIADVALRAGVGRGTVSRVLNDSPRVDPTTRARVRAAIAALGFVPSSAGRRLSLGRSHAVAVAVPLDDRPRTLALLRGVHAALAAGGLDLVLVDAADPARRARIATDVTTGGRAEGIVWAGVLPDEDEAALLAGSGIPVIVLDAVHPAFPSFASDPDPGNLGAMERAASIGTARLVEAIAERRLLARAPATDDGTDGSGDGDAAPVDHAAPADDSPEDRQPA